jgi:hypothetical protein
MKVYVVATGAVFGLITLAHVWRIVEEPRMAAEPFFLLLTAVSAALSIAALVLARRSGTRDGR